MICDYEMIVIVLVTCLYILSRHYYSEVYPTYFGYHALCYLFLVLVL